MKRNTRRQTPQQVASRFADEIEQVCASGAYPWVIAQSPGPELSQALRQLGWDGECPTVLAIDWETMVRVAPGNQLPAKPPSRLDLCVLVSLGAHSHFLRARNDRLKLL